MKHGTATPYPCSDQAMVAAAQAGDELAMTRLLQEARVIVSNWLRRRGVAPTDVEDLTQDVLVRVHRGLHGYTERPGCRFSGWIFTITKHRLFEHFRATLPEKRRRVQLPEWDDDGDKATPYVDPAEGPEQATVRAAQSAELARLLQRLAPVQREVIRLRFFRDMTQVETAEVLGMTCGAVSSCQFRAVRALRAMMAATHA